MVFPKLWVKYSRFFFRSYISSLHFFVYISNLVAKGLTLKIKQLAKQLPTLKTLLQKNFG